MKKIFPFLLIIFFYFLFINNSVYSGDRMVLVERFTSSTCPPCASNNPIMDAFLSSQDPEKIVGISFHMSWPAPGNDPFYLYNPNDNNLRRTYYNVNSIPQARMDGLINVQPPYNSSTLQGYFDSRTNILSPVTIIVTDSTFGDSIRVRALIFCESPVLDARGFIHFAYIEKFIHFQYPPGTNGEQDFYDVMRKMSPDGNGTSVNLIPGQTIILERTFWRDPIFQTNQMRTMVFAQALNQEILNASMKTLNFTLLPNPGYRVVNQGVAGSENFKIKVPVVSQGYNSPVTLTAAIDPPTSGITASFPGGNVISNFPDSVTLNVSSAASVPSGIYKVIVTGTNTNNKVHKTSVSYLIGKNWVLTNTNRNNVQYKVDNVTYNAQKFFTWDLNSTHSLAAVTPQTVGSTRYVFLNWSDGGDTAHNITSNTNISSYICNYKIQFKLITSMSPSGIPATITGGNTFYDSASVANLSISPTQVQYNGQTWYFQRWEGMGANSYTGTNPNPQINMHNIISETAVWDTLPIGITNLNNEIPKEFSLSQNYPNPFNPSTTIEFALPRSSFIELKVYDVLGNKIANIYEGYTQAGYFKTDFNASNLASGIYFYRLTSRESMENSVHNFMDVRKMLIVK